MNEGISKINNKNLKYIQVTKKDLEVAYNIQKNVWKEEPDKQNFITKANNPKDDNIAFIVYYKNIPIGITGVYTEDIEKDSIWLDWFCVKEEYRNRGFGEQILLDTIEYAKNLGRFLYFRVETTYWEDRPAISLYDKIMPIKEKYTKEDTKEYCRNILIYTYNFTDKTELWSNRYLGLNNYYTKLNKKIVNKDGCEIISPNEAGRRFSVRFKQYEFDKALEQTNWKISKNGCGPTTIATVLASFGYNETPISIAKIMLFNEFGFLSNGYYEGINGVTMIYCLNKLINQYNMDIEYEIVKINYENPEHMKEKIISMIDNGYMAIVNVGPNPNIFANQAHYIVVTSLNKDNNEFFIVNSYPEGDTQIDITFHMSK